MKTTGYQTSDTPVIGTVLDIWYPIRSTLIFILNGSETMGLSGNKMCPPDMGVGKERSMYPRSIHLRFGQLRFPTASRRLYEFKEFGLSFFFEI